MSKPQILIIGCGSVGLSVGYFLSAGASITYLVRPGRKPAFLPPKNLYSYNDNTLTTFSDYRIIESPSEVSGEKFFCIFDTLDGHTARSEGGVKTLKAVGELINEKQNVDCFVTFDAIGLDIEDHYARCLGISSDRIVLAGSLLVHPPTPQISIPAGADKDLVSKADMLLTPQPGDIGLILFNSKPALVQKLKKVYEQNGRLKIQVMPAFAEPMVMSSMLHLAAWNIDGWQDFEHLVKNKPLWSLMLKAQNEILRLPRYGWKGWFLSLIFGSWLTAKLQRGLVQGALPLAYNEFNAFHHGGKVSKQDIQLLHEIIADGEKSKHKMPALREICRMGEETQKAKGL